MATESAADPELSVTLPPSLSEWLEERAATLGMDRDALLVHLLETHRSAAELDENWLDTVDERIENIDARTRKTEGRVGDVETKLADNVEDIRERVLQLRDAVEGRAPADHSHEEFRMLTDRLDDGERRLYGLEEPTSVLRWFRQPTLLTDEGTDDGPDAEARDEDGDE